jgi:hypothetical protein
MGAHKIGKEEKAEASQEERKEAPRRKERVPFGVPQQKFGTPPNDGFKYRVFNDNWRKEPGRIQRAMDAGYEKVAESPINGMAVGTNEDGTPINGVLMRIPKEWYDEDQEKKQAEVDKVDQEILKGRFQEGPNDKRYIPSTGIHMETKLTP